ncbi:MAG: PspA-associated protein PspAA [Sulfobacillus sp.]
MIVRILHEGQYDISGQTLDQVNRLDATLLEHLRASDQAGFDQTLAQLLATVRKEGKRLSDHELRESHLILPAADFTLDEAKGLFHP